MITRNIALACLGAFFIMLTSNFAHAECETGTTNTRIKCVADLVLTVDAKVVELETTTLDRFSTLDRTHDRLLELMDTLETSGQAQHRFDALNRGVANLESRFNTLDRTHDELVVLMGTLQTAGQAQARFTKLNFGVGYLITMMSAMDRAHDQLWELMSARESAAALNRGVANVGRRSTVYLP